MDGLHLGEGCAQVGLDAVLVVDVDAGEERLVEQAALGVAALSVELAWPLEEPEAGFDDADAVRQLVLGFGQPLCEAFALVGDVAELLLDAGGGHAAVGGEVEQVAFVDVEAGEFGGELVLEQLCCTVLVGDDLADLVAHLGDELVAEGEGRVVVLDGIFDAEGVRLTPDPGQLVVWSGGLVDRLGGLVGQLVFVL